MRVRHVKLIWGATRSIKGRWFLGLFGLYSRVEGKPEDALAISLRGLALWLLGLGLAAYVAGATAVFGGADIAGAVAAVAAADVGVVLLTGEPEGESMDRQSLGIPAGQLALLAALAAQTATPLIVGVVSGGAVDQDTLRLPYRSISRPMFPLDQDFEADLKAVVVK